MTPFAAALAQFQSGRFPEAESACRAIVASNPGDASALNLLGVIAHQQGRNEEAVAVLRRAVGLDPVKPDYYYNLGVALQVLGKLDEAIPTYSHVLRLQPGRAEAHNNLGHALLLKNRLDDAQHCFTEALRLKPDYAEAQHNRGEAFRRQGRAADAVASLRAAVRLRPGFAEAFVTLGRALADLNRLDEARSALQTAIKLQPDRSDAHINLGLLFLRQGELDQAEGSLQEAVRRSSASAEAQNHLGVVLREQGRADEATKCFYRALAIEPEFASAHNNLGRMCEDQGRLEEAAARYRLALCYQAGDASVHNNLGNSLAKMSRADEALPSYQQAVRLAPDEPVYLSNLANALTLAGRPDEAEVCCRQALRLRPGFADARHNLAITLAAQGKFSAALEENAEALRVDPEHAGARNCRSLWWLQHGEFARGWPEYEWRWRVRGVQRRQFQEPAWDGQPLGGRRILLYGEQALGDTIQFIRFAPLVQALGGTVILECQPALAALIGTCAGIDQIVPRGAALPPFDVQAALLSLPGLLGTTLESVPAQIPYLHADPDLAASWRLELGGERCFKIGIAWQGSATFAGDRMRSVTLGLLEPLAQIPGVRLFSLQKGPARDQMRAVSRAFAVSDLGSTLDENGGAFVDTAALMMNLDLVITTDTSIAHVAGALGVPVWVALAVGPDWRWLLARADCPWYPTMRLFRQSRLYDWGEVFERMAAELRLALAGADNASASATFVDRRAMTPRASAAAAEPAPPRATICILTFGDYLPYFRRCLDSVLRHTPKTRFALRLGFNDAPASLAYARQVLPAENGALECQTLPGGVRRTCYASRDGMAVGLWESPVNLCKEPMARLMFHDLTLETEYAVWLDDDTYVEEGWWQALCPLLVRGADYIGQKWWVEYLPGQEDMIRAQPWHRGVPFEHRAGRAGVWFMTGGFLAIRSKRLREANFPDTEQKWKGDTLKQYGGDTLLGEIARQLGWTRAAFDVHVKINVDLEGKYPAPRRGGTGRQFGAEVDVVVG